MTATISADTESRRRESSPPASLVPGTELALVHDYLLVLRGAERTFLELSRLWPDSPIYTLLYDEDATRGAFRGRTVQTSRLQRLGVRQSGFRKLLPLYPSAVQRLPLDRHRVIVSSSSAFAHGVRPHREATHICYCHSPFRYAWHERDRALRELPPPARPLLDLALARHRGFDRRAAGRVTRFVANSQITRERIRRYWHCDADVVHPPVDVHRFHLAEPDDYFLFVGEVVGHKRVELALEAAERARQRLVVVGTGPDLERLRARYGRRAEFLGRVDDERLTQLYARARALVVPNVEEFGIAAVEAQAAGRPVIAANAGGARETVLDDQTGRLVPPDDAGALARAMGTVDELLPAEAIRWHAQRFSPERFRQSIGEVVAQHVR